MWTKYVRKILVLSFLLKVIKCTKSCPKIMIVKMLNIKMLAKGSTTGFELESLGQINSVIPGGPKLYFTLQFYLTQFEPIYISVCMFLFKKKYMYIINLNVPLTRIEPKSLA